MPRADTAVAMLALVLTLACVGCKAKEPTAKPHEPAATVPTQPPTEQPDAQPQTPPGEPEVALAKVNPVPIPADWPTYARVEDIPEDSFGEVVTRSAQNLPVVFTLENDVALQGYPCLAGQRISAYVDGGGIAGCSLAVDFSVAEGLSLAKGTEIKTQPDGTFTGFVLRQPQVVLGLPVKENQIVYWTRTSGLGAVTLANSATVLGIDFKARTQLYFRSNAQMRSLQSALLAGEHTIGGQTYRDGQTLEFDAENRVTKAR